MNTDERAFNASVDAFRRATASATDGGATRARVLGAAVLNARRGALLRRATLALAIALVAALSGSAAWTAIGRWRARSPAPARASSAAFVRPARLAGRAHDPVDGVAAAAVAPDARAAIARHRPDSGNGEAMAYGHAHAAHFEADDPGRALVLWEAYLRDYPTGAFVPEARFNRALCLVRLGRRDEAGAALRPFVAGAYGGYRRREAETLSDWIITRE